MAEQSPILLPLELRSIYVRSMHSETMPTFNPTIGGQQLAGEFRVTPSEVPIVVAIDSGTDDHATLLSFISSFEFRYSRVIEGIEMPIPSPGDICATICVDIAAEYQLTGEMPSAEHLKGWGETISLNHVWPYWREFCASTMTRMSLPLAIAPLLNIRTKAPELADEIALVPPRQKRPSRKKLNS